MDNTTTLEQIKEKVKIFCEEREWDQYHNPKELATALILEASELLEHFRYKSEEEVDEIIKNPETRQKVEEEMADVLLPLFRIAQKYDIDLSNAFLKKMEKNALNYPIEKAKGKNKKYSEY